MMDWKEKLGVFLDGYTMASDVHPVWERRLFEEDAEALKGDWEAVGRDLALAGEVMCKYGKALGELAKS